MNNIVDGATFSFEIKKENEETLSGLLKQVHDERNDLKGIIPFRKAEHLHYASFVMLPEETAPNMKSLPPRLLVLTTFTGNRKKHIEELISLSPESWHRIFSCCAEYKSENFSENSLLHFMIKHRRSNTVYNAYQYFSKEDAEREGKLRNLIEEYLDGVSKDTAFLSLSPQKIRERIQNFVKSQPELLWAITPFRIGFSNYLRWNYKRILLLSGVPALLICSVLSLFIHSLALKIIAIIFLIALLLLILMIVFLRISESHRDPQQQPTDQHIFDITSKEKAIVTNEMSVIGPVKREWIRHVFLAFVLQFLKPFRPIMFIPTVHMARWAITDHVNRVIFIAYFDNTSEGYANDFVDSENRSRRLNLIFGNGYGFPPTKFAVYAGGASDRRGYMNAVRKNQRITSVWYSTHETLGILNVLNNRAIRKGLFGKMKDEEIKNWLLHF
ncbi:MAG: hypothetical protein ACHQD9_07340 [Chitinophagales bacterium]